MRLRRLELVIIGVTLAFACFMGGFFTGRSWSAVNIIAAPAQQEEVRQVVDPPAPVAPAVPEASGAPEAVPPVESAVPEGAGGGAGQAQEAVAAPAGDGRININLASQGELTDLPGIGSVLASRIVDYRRQHGDFSRIEDLRGVSGIGEKRFDAIRDKITVG